MTQDTIALVDRQDTIIGTAGKLEAHRRRLLHRAFSVFVFDGQGRMLLQRRSALKYHSAGLWANSCCGHPRPDDKDVGASAQRRLTEEMGIACALSPLFQTIYEADVGQGLFEHEYVHAFHGRFDGDPRPDPDEVGEWAWRSVPEILRNTGANPQRYAAWFQIYLRRFENLITRAAGGGT